MRNTVQEIYFYYFLLSILSHTFVTSLFDKITEHFIPILTINSSDKALNTVCRPEFGLNETLCTKEEGLRERNNEQDNTFFKRAHKTMQND